MGDYGIHNRSRKRTFHKGEHQKCFAYSAHSVCDRNNFILEVEVTPGNIHDSIVFDTVYDKVAGHFPEVEVVTANAGYKTPWICKKYLITAVSHPCHINDP
ncbi:MAG: transposase [Caldicoprobacterales bacterium]